MFSDGALALLQIVVPLMAFQRFHASLFMVSVVIAGLAQAFRLPVCLASGPLSEKIGRARIAVPAALVMAVACFGLTRASSSFQIFFYYTLFIMALGAFYPPLQALISDVSKSSELAGNLLSFNAGWCIGGALAGFLAGLLLKQSIVAPFYAAAVAAAISGLIVFAWRNNPRRIPRVAADVSDAPGYPPYLLIIARMGHFTAYFGFAAVANLFPKLALSQLHWSNAAVATLGAMLRWGMAAGLLSTMLSPWWRGKIWPLLLGLGIILASGITIGITSSPVLLSTAFFSIGATVGLLYTAAIFYGLSGSKKRGKSSGIHESLLAAGNISGCFLGWLAAEFFDLRAPYFLLAMLAAICLIATYVLTRENSNKQHCKMNNAA